MSTHPEPRRFPPLDERLVEPESRLEMIDGEVRHVPPAKYPHARHHATLTSLLEAHVVEGYVVAVDLLMRVSERSDFAPDVSVRPRGEDPERVDRQLDALSFEIVSTQALSVARAKAIGLSERGVRRVFAIDVKRHRVLEWSAARGDWVDLPSDGAIADPVLGRPLPVSDLLSVTRTDDAVARALLARRNRVLEEEIRDQRAAGEAAGRVAGLAAGQAAGRVALVSTVLEALSARGLSVPSAVHAAVLATTDLDRLRELAVRAATCTTARDLLD